MIASDNLRGAALMTLAMAGFALEDTFLKILSGTLPIGQIFVMLGSGGAICFACLARLKGQAIFFTGALSRPVLIRNLGELIAAVGWLAAIALTPLSSAAAILQATPLAVTLGAALFMGAEVGWRRWAAILVGFLGVLMIIRPGLSGFEPASLFAVLGVIGLAIRDLATRAVPAHISSLQLSAHAFAIVVPVGALMLLVGGGGVMPTPLIWVNLAAALFFGVVAYYWIVGAMRVGEVAVVTPFRYTRLIFALLIGVLIFGERPDLMTLLGAGIIIASGLYTFLRERALGRRAATLI
ncbi:DMT family transporter [Roseovarius sp. LXJ103]|uniref:DMT family transporter n=1 Tax=Roseovarius carneus TaxID=2853164 RepID=UPI000D60CBA5|nr:DMT family transporter [Roseovarius carneus]MBZ8119245.1 DMT family transporter [Roseovarius carneus]PWE35131.1 EamA family transporter [Pelagicola sp. LXJ1103]